MLLCEKLAAYVYKKTPPFLAESMRRANPPSSNEEKNTEEGKIASDFTKELLTGKQVYLEFDVDMYDDYDRMLAYVYTSDYTMVNKLLITKGYARMMTIQPNVKYETDFYQLQKKARENQTGFWDSFSQWQ